MLGAGLSAIQLVPSWEFLRQTTLPNGLPPDIASYFSFPLAHLGSFIQPFVLGDPRIGTYPHFASFDGSIFWENTGYIGLLPLVLTIPTLWYKHTKIRFFLCVIAVSFLLMWGSHSPLYIIYSIWPFNLFRVPSRFLWLFVFSIVTLASIGLNYLMQNLKNKFLFISLIMLAAANVIHLFVLWQNYHLFVSARDWMNPPQILTLIPSAARIYTIGSEITHNKFFLSQGWKNTSPFVFLRNDLAPDSNLIWGRANFGVYAGRTLRRTDIFSALLAQNVHISENQATPSALYKTLLDVSSVTTLISTVPLDESQIHDSKKPFKREKVYTGAGTTLYLYTNPNARPRAYLASGAKTVSTVEDSARALADNPSERNVLVERRLPFTEQKSGGTVQVRDTNDTNVSIAVENNPGDAILVLTDTIYPGWIARTDGEVTPIVPVNIQFRGIKIPAGTHSITFEYKPASFRIGATVTSIFMIIIVFLAVFPE
ncbi:YfhO family protein, partial [Candidatus Gottesmanbacteria bacterium]|nr:YfhO family protein [Candidatus Gottesmanbacteria bacterium]